MVHPEVMLPERFRYMDRIESPSWTQKVQWERRTLPALGSFVFYHLCFCYGLRETARYRLLARVTQRYSLLEVCQRFRYEQESILSYLARAFIDDQETGLWLVAYMEGVVHV